MLLISRNQNICEYNEIKKMVICTYENNLNFHICLEEIRLIKFFTNF